MDVKFSDPHGFNEKIWGESWYSAIMLTILANNWASQEEE
jgi:hypothetical protein